MLILLYGIQQLQPKIYWWELNSAVGWKQIKHADYVVYYYKTLNLEESNLAVSQLKHQILIPCQIFWQQGDIISIIKLNYLNESLILKKIESSSLIFCLSTRHFLTFPTHINQAIGWIVLLMFCVLSYILSVS